MIGNEKAGIHTENDRVSPRKGQGRMGTAKKYLTAAGLGLMLLAGMTGCAGEAGSLRMEQEEADDQAVRAAQGEQDDGAAEQVEEDRGKAAQGEPVSEENSLLPQENTGKYQISKEEGTEFLPGKIQSVEADSMVVARTTVKSGGEDASSVTIVDEKDAEKITVKFAEDIKVEHWIILGGGAGIDMRDAALSDLEPGMGVEIEGYYEGEAFAAVRILIEEYK